MGKQNWIDTGELVDDLKGRSARGGVHTVAAQVLKVVVEAATTLILARLLAPEDFGIVGMVIVITGFVSLFQDLGLSMATVQKEEISHDEVSALFWINSGLGLALTVLTALAAPIVAWVYGVPELQAVTLAVSIAFLLGSVGVQHQALLRRQMFLGRLAIAELVSIVGSLILAVFLALEGWGYFALVAKIVLAPLLMSLGVWAGCSWRPSFPKRTDVRELLKFGGNLTGFSLVNYFARNLDDFLIGRLFGAQELGFYQKAYEVLMVPLRQLNAPVSSLAIPLLSRLVSRPEVYRKTYLRLFEKILLITMPAAGWLVGSGDWLIVVVLGEQWVMSGPIVMWLGLSLISQPLGNSTGWLFITQDRTDEMFRWGWIGAGTAVVSFVVGLPWGAVGVAAAYSLVGLFVRTPWLLWFVTRSGPVRARDILARAYPMLLAGFATFGATVAYRRMAAGDSAVENLVIATALSCVVAVVVLLVHPVSRAAIFDLRVMVRSLKGKDSDE